MIRDTSIHAYQTIKDNGLLSERRWQVYDCLYHHGPATGNELLLKFTERFGKFNGNSPVVTSRLSELRDLGVAVEVRERPCTITGHNAIEWAVLDCLPHEKKSKAEHCYWCDGCNQRFVLKPTYHSKPEAPLFPCYGIISKWKKVK